MDIEHLRALLSGERQEPVTVGSIYDAALVRAVRAARTHAVLLPRETVVKQASRHPDIGFEQYRLLPYILRYGVVTQEWGDHLIFSWVDHDERRYRLMVMSTPIGHLHVKSFHRLAAKQIRAILERGQMLRRHA